MKRFNSRKLLIKMGDKIEVNPDTGSGATGNPSGLEFPIVASDNVWPVAGDNGGLGHFAKTGGSEPHQAWTNTGTAGWKYDDDAQGSCNFALDDTSVKTFLVDKYSYLNPDWVTGSVRAILPVELGR